MIFQILTWIVASEEESQHSAARANRPKVGSADHRQKPLHLRDYQRKALLANKGVEFDTEVDGNAWKPTPVEEAEHLREETKRAFHDHAKGGELSGVGSSDEVEDLLIPREKVLGEVEQEEEDYQQFLLDRVGRDDIMVAFQSHPEPTGVVKVDESTVQDEETFLRNYVLGRGWLDKDIKKIPQYAEIVKSHGRPPKTNLEGPSGANAQVLGRTAIDEEQDDEEDEEFVEQAEEFEAKYNFRFEKWAILSFGTRLSWSALTFDSFLGLVQYRWLLHMRVARIFLYVRRMIVVKQLEPQRKPANEKRKKSAQRNWIV